MQLKKGDYVRIIESKVHKDCIGVIEDFKEIQLRDTKQNKKSYKVRIIDHSLNKTCN